MARDSLTVGRAHDLRVGDIVIFRKEKDTSFHVTLLGPNCCEIQYGSCLDGENNLEQESDEESSQDERSFKKRTSPWKASSSSSQNRLVTVTLTPYNVRASKLDLPIPFMRTNDINKETKIGLLDKNGVKWSTNTWFEEGRKRMRLIGGWKEFCKANCVKIGESIEMELIWEADRSCVLKYCLKVKPKTK